jgi:hypothetical protein
MNARVAFRQHATALRKPRISFRELHNHNKKTHCVSEPILSKAIVTPRGGFHTSPTEPRQNHSYWDQLFAACGDQTDWLKNWVGEAINRPYTRIPAVILTGRESTHGMPTVIHSAIAKLMSPSIASHRWKSCLHAAEIPEMRLVSWEAGASWHAALQPA